MGNNNINGGVNNDSLAKLKEIIADGKVEAKELKGLTEAEKEALEKYLQGEGKSLPKEGEITYLREPSNSELLADAAKKSIPEALGVLWDMTLGLFTSCKVEDDEPQTIIKGDTTDINNKVEINIKQDVQAIVDAIKELKDADEVQHKELMTNIGKLLSRLEEQGQKLDDIVTLLKDQGLSLEIITQILIDSGKNTAEILKVLKKVGGDVKDLLKALQLLKLDTTAILEALKGAGAQLGDIAVQLKDNKEILNEISGKNTKILEALNKLLAQGDKISGEYKTILNDILNKIGTMNSTDLSKVEAKLADIIAKLEKQIANGEKASEIDQAFYNAMLSKLDKLDDKQTEFFNNIYVRLDNMNKDQAELVKKLLLAIEKNTTVSENTCEIANKILEAMDKVGGDNKDYSDILNKILEKLGTINSGGGSTTDLSKVEALLDAILGKIETSIDNQDKMAADNLAFYNALLEKLDGMKGDNAQAFKDLLDAIKENTEVAKGTFTVANKILAAMDKLGDKADEAINVLKSLSSGGECNFNPEDMKAFIEAVVQGMKDTYTAGNEKLLAKLDEILNKIPEGCKCDHSELLAKIEIIISKMEKPDSNDNSHEGIIGDLEDIFG